MGGGESHFIILPDKKTTDKSSWISFLINSYNSICYILILHFFTDLAYEILFRFNLTLFRVYFLLFLNIYFI
jgi:hypothetical protein